MEIISVESNQALTRKSRSGGLISKIKNSLDPDKRLLDAYERVSKGMNPKRQEAEGWLEIVGHLMPDLGRVERVALSIRLAEGACSVSGPSQELTDSEKIRLERAQQVRMNNAVGSAALFLAAHPYRFNKYKRPNMDVCTEADHIGKTAVEPLFEKLKSMLPEDQQAQLPGWNPSD